jgi:hypothetical protein
VKEKEK